MNEIYRNLTDFDNMRQGEGVYVQTHSFLAEKKLYIQKTLSR